MEELKSLEELNEEYKQLKKEVETLKNSFKEKEDGFTSIERENTRLNSVYIDAKRAYENAKKALEMFEQNNKDENGNDILDLTVNRQQVENLEKKMMEAEQDKNDYNEKVYKPQKTEFETFKQTAKEKSNRMKLILTSFAVNDKINETLKDELEIEYESKIEEENGKKSSIQDLQKTINEDYMLNNLFTKINTKIKEYNECLEKVNKPENGRASSADIAMLKELDDEISSLTSSAKARITMISVNNKEHKIEETDISQEDCEKMAIEKANGKDIVINKLQNKITNIENVVNSLNQEKEDKIKALDAVKQMVHNEDTQSEEELKLLKELEQHNIELTNAEDRQKESDRRLLELAKQIKVARETLKNEELANVNADKIKKLEDELKLIEAEVIEYKENTVTTELYRRLQELQQLKSTYNAKEESQEHKDAVLELELAKIDLEAEEKSPTIDGANESDEIIVNPLYADLEMLRDSVIDAVTARNEEVKKLKEQKEKLDEKVKQDKDEIKSLQDENDSVFGDIAKTYIGEETCPEFIKALQEGKEDNPVVILFNKYKNAELNLRKAMLKLKQNPTKAQMQELYRARQEYNDIAIELQDKIIELDEGNYGINPSIEAIHKYLESTLKSELDSGKELDEAYNIATMKNRLNELRKAGTSLEEEEIEDIEEIYAEFDKKLKLMLLGKNNINNKDLEKLRKDYEFILGTEDYDKIADILEGKGLPEDTKKKNIFQRAFSFFSRNKIVKEYDVDKNEKPKKLSEYNEKEQTIKDKQKQNEKDSKELDILEKDYMNKFRSELTDLEKSDFDKAEDGLNNLKANGVPRKINKTKLDRLKDLKKKAEEKLAATPFNKGESGLKDIIKEIGRIETELKDKPIQIPVDEKAAEDKEKRIKDKKREIEEAKKVSKSSLVEEKQKILEKLLKFEKEEKSEKESAEKELKRLREIIIDKKDKLNIIQKAKKAIIAVKGLIKIKNPRHFGYRKSGDIAEDLAKDAKEIKEEDLEL